ncbi:dTDP-4-dehydrorhamnose reductase [Longispora fulva]|uniref:dTDP-4-dehydrorhamnose reductase n=1 Tax=Longispora fulva TaxID=619741 RepID=UPI0018C9D9D9|nr:dTDP-4-dehydrorhamnose reductase [Longispora fulva]
MTRWLVTGAGGMLGRDLLAALDSESVTAAARADLDVTDPAAVLDAVAGHAVVVNLAAWTDVDGAESAEAAATAVNGDGPAHLAVACARHGARLIQLSTDYVLSGGTAPYPEDAPAAPVNAYGRGKLAGERAVLAGLPDAGYVLRTSWLYGAGGPNFVATMLRRAAEPGALVDVVDDQRGQPTWSGALADMIADLGRAALDDRVRPGVYHGTAAGETTWYGLARAVFAEAGHDPDRVRPIGSVRLARPAVRPAYSVLGHDRWAGTPVRPLGPWREMLTRALRTF